MERILYFDCFAGISGDMTIAALLDLGIPEETVLKELSKLGVSGFDIVIRKIRRFSISGTDVKVNLTGEVACEHEHQGHGHNEEFRHHHDHEERGLTEISHIINSSGISERAKRLAIAIFTEIAKAEAAVHGKSVGEVHFHEVGAIDSIVDIVTTAICLDLIHADRIVCSPVHDGQGFIHCQHGKLPIPVPAVAKMLEHSGIPVITEEVQAELVTPTGFGILKTVKDQCGKMPEMVIDKIGYGFGKTETGSLNALRIVLGHVEAEDGEQIREAKEDTIAVLETNLDDCSPEVLGYVMQRLFDAGALDTFYTPIYMKKNRPAVMLSVLCEEDKKQALIEMILKETGSLGIRVRQTKRVILKRELVKAMTSLGEVRMKTAVIGGQRFEKPEEADCERLAKEHNLPLRKVMEIIQKERA